MTPEISAVLKLEAARPAPRTLTRTANAAELAAIADRLGVDRAIALTLEGRLRELPGGDVFEASGRATLQAERVCIVRLEPFVETTEAEFVERITQNPTKASDDGAAVSPDLDEIELIETDSVDFGEMALQYLAMALSPNPRSPEADAEAAPAADPSDGGGDARRPFAGLDKLLRDSAKKT